MTIPKTLPNTDSRSDRLFFGAFPRLFGHPCQMMSKQFGGVGLSAISFYCPLEGTTGVFPPLNKKDAAAIPNAAPLWGDVIANANDREGHAVIQNAIWYKDVTLRSGSLCEEGIQCMVGNLPDRCK